LGCSPATKTSEVTKDVVETAKRLGSWTAIFDDRTADLGVVHTYLNGEDADELSILESIGGGLAAFDFDRDGFEDLFFPGGGRLMNKTIAGRAGSLWRNRAGQKFMDVTTPSNTDLVSKYTHGAITGDLNDDGFADILVTGYDGVQLFWNQGDGTFLESALTAGITETQWSTSGAFGDFDNDGFLDIYLAHYVDWSFSKHPPCKSLGVPDVCPPGSFTGFTDVVYMNQGNQTFVAKSSELGLVPEGKGLGVMITNLNKDSLVDIYVANDTTNNFLYENLGGKFREIGLESGTAVDDVGTPQGSMGLCLLDFDHDMQPDIWVCNYENQAFALYKNDGEFNFRYATSATGLMALGTTYVAFGTVSGDFDLDGDEDIVVSNGHVMRLKSGGNSSQHPLYLVNEGGKKFVRQTFANETYFGKKWRGRGVVSWDWDNDGDLDLAFSHVNQPTVVLENKTETDGNWWKIELVGTQSNRDAIGARIIFKSNKQSYLRNVVGGGSYLSQNPYSIHFGLPAGEELIQTEIVWPNGSSQVIPKLVANTSSRVVEPTSLSP
jgi:enediyne biosynthesis protein E4